MPFSDPLCAQYSLSVIKNLSRGNRRFFSCCRTDKRKNLPLQIHYIKRRPVCQYDAPAPFAGDPRPLFARPPVRESHTFARATHSRETSAPRVFFGARDPPRSHLGCDVSETTQTPSAGDLRPSCLFWWRAIPLGHTPGAPPRQLRSASPQESAPKPSQKHPQSPKKPSDKPQKPSDKPHPQNVPKIPQKTA